MEDSIGNVEEIYLCLRRLKETSSHKDPNQAVNDVRNLNYLLHTESLQMYGAKAHTHGLSNLCFKFNTYCLLPETMKDYQHSC